MENDVLKNKIAPWQEKGRWYKFTILSNGTDYSVDSDNTDDKNAFLSGSNGYINTKFKYISDIKFRLDDNTSTSNTNINTTIIVRAMSDGTFSFRFQITPTLFTKCTVWVFGEMA